MDSLHYVIEGVFALIGFLAAFVINGMKADIRDKQTAITDLQKLMTDTRLDVERRVHQTEWKETMTKIFEEFKDLREMFHSDRRKES